jgi:hypothetical protein
VSGLYPGFGEPQVEAAEDAGGLKPTVWLTEMIPALEETAAL